MMILQQDMVRLENDVITSNNPDSSLCIYLAAAPNVEQFRLVAANRREKEEAKKNRKEESRSNVMSLTRSI